MRVLSIESSGHEFSVALLESTDGKPARLTGESFGAPGERTAQAIAPRLQSLLRGCGWAVDSVELVAVTAGPGSFTGLRIGVTTAKTLAFAVGAQVIGINTLAAIAERAPREASPLWTVMDAQRQELFVTKFGGDQPAGEPNAHILTQSEWLAELRSGDHVSGPGLRRLASALPAGVQVVDEALWRPTAAAAGQLAWRQYQAGKRDDVWRLVPQYYRRSAAEEKRERSGSG